VVFGSTEAYTNELRKCPGGSFTTPPFTTATWDPSAWNCWIGANFGRGNGGAYTLSGPLYYRMLGPTENPPLKGSHIKKPADALIYMDSLTHYVYSPVDSAYRFTLDKNGDGLVDTMPQYPNTPFNNARPTVHGNGANVTLMDGHIERVAFRNLWNVVRGFVTHSFWYLED
jgi:prepilin-type processing-associated H-X9-DG protein